MKYQVKQTIPPVKKVEESTPDSFFNKEPANQNSKTGNVTARKPFFNYPAQPVIARKENSPVSIGHMSAPPMIQKAEINVQAGIAISMNLPLVIDTQTKTKDELDALIDRLSRKKDDKYTSQNDKGILENLINEIAMAIILDDYKKDDAEEALPQSPKSGEKKSRESLEGNIPESGKKSKSDIEPTEKKRKAVTESEVAVAAPPTAVAPKRIVNPHK